jgi:hypothetical protein
MNTTLMIRALPLILLCAGCDSGLSRGEPDAMVGTDAPMAADPCAADSTRAAETVGCNGGFLEDAVPGEIGGPCTRPDPDVARGTCSDEVSVCMVPPGLTEGICATICPVLDTYVGTGGCPAGHRCFRVATTAETIGVCYLDCDEEAHPCPEGFFCDSDQGCDF